MDFDWHKHEDVEWPKVPIPEMLGLAFGTVILWEFFYVRTLMPLVEKWAERQPFYAALAHRSGNLAHNGQDDITLLIILAVHHGTAGSLTLLGSVLGKPWLFEIGAMLELGFEIADTSSMVRGVWPHEKSREQPIIKLALFLHHLPGLFLTIPVMHYGEHEDPHIRAVCSWLLFAGGVSALAGAIVHTRDFEDPWQMKQAAIAQTIGAAFFIYARFTVFPLGIFNYTNDLEDAGESLLANAVRVLSLALMGFNIIVLKLNLVKSLKYAARAFFGFKYDLNDLKKVVARKGKGSSQKKAIKKQ